MGEDTIKTSDANSEQDGRVKGLEAGIAAERSKRHGLERELSELKGELQALKSTSQAPAQTMYTRQQLEAFVDAGQMSKEQADTVYETQLREQVSRDALKQATDVVTQSNRERDVLAQIERYKEAIPDVMSAGTDARNRVEQEFQYLVGLGDTPNQATELKALRAVYGPVERLAGKGEPARETHQDTGGGKDDESDNGMRKDGIPKGLTAAQREYYRPLIGRVYKSWGDVQEELKHQNKRLSERYSSA